jgi:poly(3-hydroxybutyrate) depolymerase
LLVFFCFLVVINTEDPPKDGKYVVIGSNTYTPNIINYSSRWAVANKSPYFSWTVQNNSPVYTWLGKQSMPVVHIQCINKNHTWTGHKGSGPGADQTANFVFDSTVMLCHFLKIGYKNYIPSVQTNVEGIPTYKTRYCG